MNTNANSVQTQTRMMSAAHAFGRESRIVSIAFGTPLPFEVRLTGGRSRQASSARWAEHRIGQRWEDLCYVTIWASGWVAIALALL